YGKRGMGVDEGGSLGGHGLPTHRVHELMDQLAGHRSDNRSAHDRAALLYDKLHGALVLADDGRPRPAPEAVRMRFDLDPGFGRLCFVEPDFGYLGMGVRDPGNGPVVDRLGFAGGDVGHGSHPLGESDMSELGGAGHDV